MGLALGTVAFGQVRNDRLYNDIAAGEVNELNLSLAGGIDVNAEVFRPGHDEHAFSLLELSVLAKNDQAAAQLLQLGAEVDHLAERFETGSPLVLFAEQGMIRTLTTYIDRDNSVLVEEGGKAFLEAAWADEIPIAQLLLDRTIALVGQDQLQAPLDEALAVVAGNNDVAATELLIERGADPSSGLPLVVAVANCSPETVEKLLGYTADALPNYEGEHVASYAHRCFSEQIDETEEDAVDKFSKIVQLLHEADPTICPILVDVQNDESSRVDSVLENLGICQ